jgi:hypothetical protein
VIDPELEAPFTGPLERSASGTIRFTVPSS